MRRFAFLCAFLLALPALILAPRQASAHPHVWVTMKSELLFSPEGMLIGVRQAWTFDEAFTAFALQGLDRKPDGTYSDEVLKPLAEVNVTSLKEYGYFSTGKTATAKFAFTDPVDYYLTFKDDALTLHFTLPLAKPMPAKGMLSVEVNDPTIFISFSFAETDPVKMVGAPAGCTLEVVTPQAPPGGGQLSEAFFNSLTATSTYGAQFADRSVVKCP